MPTVDEIQNEIISQASGASEDATSLVADLGAALIKARAARDKENAVRNKAESLRTAERLPKEFIGIIRDYRFGMLDVGIPEPGSKNGAMPTHRFEVECSDSLWLHVRVGSDKFDPFLASTSIKDFRGGESLNGLTVTVKRDKAYGGLVPIGLGLVFEDLDSIGQDAQGNDLFKGDMVRLREAPSGFYRTFKAQVIDFDQALWTFQRPDRKNPVKLTQRQIESYYKFEKVTS